MSDIKALIPIEDHSRRDLLRTIALTITAAAGGSLNMKAAEHIHGQAQEEKRSGSYRPKLFNDREFATIGRLAELIVPADEVSGSARDAGAPEFIDLLCSQNLELARIYTGGLAWLDSEMKRRYAACFVDSKAEQQTALLDALVNAERALADNRMKGLTYEGSRQNREFSSYGFLPSTDLGPGIHFFSWIRKMTVDAFYTSEIGIQDVGFRGNQVRTSYEVPREAMDYALKRSPFGQS